MSIVSTLPVTPLTPSAPPAVPRLRAVRPHTAEPRTTAEPAWAAFPHRLPEGATVLAALPQTALPEHLLEQYADVVGDRPGAPMVGYLVLVPAGAAEPPTAAPPAATLPTLPVAPTGIVLDADRRTAHVDGAPVDLTYLEFELLAHLTAHPHRVHSRDHLVSSVWGYGYVGDGRTVDVHIARLRRKLGPAYRGSIVTVRRVGYKYTPQVRR
ncbi:winged helix-turn-helix domain-containing protein [Peterkaempfera bronchialis]|uniref:winged helix-turn-helix domain-containing protein n=1 Tax=Peterkaempfera bronchialis TaxID=2126346 RepID=UPI003C2D50B9